MVEKYKISMAGYHPQQHKLLIDTTSFSNLNAAALRWLMLHETGHAQMPYVVPTIQKTLTAATLVTPYFWGMHKRKPYRNIITKLGSKALATIAVRAFINCNAFRTEERRADSFANKHADEQTLKGGVEALSDHKNNLERAYQQARVSSVMSSGLFSNLVDPLHPSVDSRISKTKKALKTRFGVEV